jgi:hypothetical protein
VRLCAVCAVCAGLRKVYARFTRGLRVVYAWFTRGLRKVYAWCAHGLRVVCVRVLMVCAGLRRFAQVCAGLRRDCVYAGLRKVYARFTQGLLHPPLPGPVKFVFLLHAASGHIFQPPGESLDSSSRPASAPDHHGFAQGLRKVFTHDLRMAYARFTHGLRMVYARFTHGLRMVCAWFAQGLRKVYAWFAHGLRMVCARVLMVCAGLRRFAQRLCLRRFTQGLRKDYARFTQGLRRFAQSSFCLRNMVICVNLEEVYAGLRMVYAGLRI